MALNGRSTTIPGGKAFSVRVKARISVYLFVVLVGTTCQIFVVGTTWQIFFARILFIVLLRVPSKECCALSGYFVLFFYFDCNGSSENYIIFASASPPAQKHPTAKAYNATLTLIFLFLVILSNKAQSKCNNMDFSTSAESVFIRQAKTQSNS